MRNGQRVVILGGGAGGLELASLLGGGGYDVDVVLVDRDTTHVWKPRLHEMAAGSVATSLAEISFYLLSQLRGFRFEQGEVVSVDRERRLVRLAPLLDAKGREAAPARAIRYDRLVIALGGVTPDFGVEGVRENAVRLDTPADADAFRQRFIALMIGARESGTPAEIAIVGTGPTGSELAAHLRQSERAFLDPGDLSRGKLLAVTLIEAAPEIMPGVSAELRRGVLDRLRSLDVKIVTDAEISAVGERELRTAKGESWPSDLTVWATGNSGHPLLAQLGDFETDRKGRIPVDSRLRAMNDDRVYVIGDAAAFTPPGADRPLGATAQAASQQALYLARALPKTLDGEAVDDFSYGDRGQLVSLASAGAVGRVGLPRRDDLLIDGHFAKAAYYGLERQHQWRVLGPVRGTVAILADMVSPAKGPALKLYGD